MPPSMTIQTVTNQHLVPAWFDTVLKDNMFFGEVLGNTQRFEKYEGSQMLFPIKYQKGVSSVSFSGFDQLPTTQQAVSVNATFYPTFVACNVAIAKTDLSVNDTKERTLNLMKTTMQSRSQDMADDIGTLFQGNGVGKDPSGLGNIVDDGSVASTYGGLSRATYTGLNATVTASGGTISLLKMRQLANPLTDGSVAPNFALGSYDTWTYIEQLLQPFQRNVYDTFDGNMGMKSASGYKGLAWDGLVIQRDKKVASGNLFMLNTDYLRFYGLKYWQGESVSLEDKDIKGNIYENYNKSSLNKAFTWTNWIQAYNQSAINGFVIMAGQLICPLPLRNGKLTGITGV